MLLQSKNPTVIKLALLEYFCLHNIPQTINIDNVKEFNNDLMKDFSTK